VNYKYPTKYRSFFPGPYGQGQVADGYVMNRGFARLGWNATGDGVPERGTTHWGRLGYLLATIDCARLSLKHRVWK
jgi:hypothetical protein